VLLYKYLSPNRFDVLESKMIRFTQPEYFNDPFEFNPVIDRLFSKNFADSIISNLISNPAILRMHLGLRYKEFSENNNDDMLIGIYKKINFLYLYSINEDDFRSKTLTVQEEINKANVNDFLSTNDIRNEVAIEKQMQIIEYIFIHNPVLIPIIELWVSSQMMDFSENQVWNFASEFRKSVNTTIGVLCLSEVWDNQIMWAHYGHDYKGFVVGFDTKNNFFDQKKSPTDMIRHVHKVRYAQERPHITLTDLISNKLTAEQQMDLFVDTFVYTKSSNWSYESEWRMIMDLEDANISPENGNDLYLFRIPIDCIAQVIMGCRITSELSGAIKELIINNPSMQHIQLFKTNLDPSDYCLSLSQM